jgi:hypothetical protein
MARRRGPITAVPPGGPPETQKPGSSLPGSCGFVGSYSVLSRSGLVVATVSAAAASTSTLHAPG